MAKRTRKQALIGAGILIGISATSIASGLVSKHIIDQNKINSLKQNNDNNNLLDPKNTNIGNYNIATKDMFIDTQYLNFHMGHAGIGQTLTPWGWLGNYEPTGNKSGYDSGTLTLTGWNGQVLWLATNESGFITSKTSYSDGSSSKNYGEIYDAKYDHNNNWILVVRYSDNSTQDGNNKKNGLKGMTLQVLDAKTGKELCKPTSIPDGGRAIEGANSTETANWNNLARNEYKRYQNYVQMGDKLLWGFFTNINKIKDDSNKSVATEYDNFEPYDYFGHEKSPKAKFMDFLVIEKTNNNVTIKNVEYENKGYLGWSTSLYGSTMLSSPIMTKRSDQKINITFLTGEWEIKTGLSNDVNITNIKQPYFELSFDGSSLRNNEKINRGVLFGSGTNKDAGIIKYNKSINPLTKKTFVDNWKNEKQKISDFVTHPVQNILGLNNYSIPILYAVKGDRSVYSVLNVVLDNSGNYDVTKSKYFSPGYDANAYVETHGIKDLDNTTISQKSKIDFNLFPNPKDGILNNISNNAFMYGPFAISPFDGTIVFSARPNYRITNNFQDEFSLDSKSFISLSIASPTASKLQGNDKYQYTTFVLSNELKLAPESNDYTNGRLFQIIKNLTFDLYGTYKFDVGFTPKIKLYFNTNGNKKDNFTSMNGNNNLKTNAIGVINVSPKHNNNLPGNSFEWMETITNDKNAPEINDKNNDILFTIDEKNLFAYVSSMANPNNWYSRTWYNLANSENTIVGNNEVINTKLTNRTFVDNLEAKINNIGNDGQTPNSPYTIDILSNYHQLDESAIKQSPFWRPTVIAKGKNNNEQTNGKLLLEYQYDYFLNKNSGLVGFAGNNIGFSKLDNYQNDFWQKQENNISFTYEINDVSILLTKALVDNVKISNISGRFGKDDLSITTKDVTTKESPKIGDTYGTNNDLNDLLCVEYGLVFNENNANGEQTGVVWEKAANNNEFNGTYNFDNFKTKLKEFMKWKVNNLVWKDTSKGVYGVNNLTIRSYLKFDPTKVKGNQIWDVTSILGLSIDNKKAYATYGNDGKLYIYKDEKYGSNDHLIFQQNSETFQQNKDYGFTNSIKEKMYDSSSSHPSVKEIIEAPNKDEVNLIIDKNNSPFKQIDVDLKTKKIKFVFQNDDFVNIFKNYNQMLSMSLLFQASTSVNINENDLKGWVDGALYSSKNIFRTKNDWNPYDYNSYFDWEWQALIKENNNEKYFEVEINSLPDEQIKNDFLNEKFKTFIVLGWPTIGQLNKTSHTGGSYDAQNLVFSNWRWHMTAYGSWWKQQYWFKPLPITYNQIDTGITQNNFKKFQWNNSTTLNFVYSEEPSENQYANKFERHFSIVQKTPSNIYSEDLNNVIIDEASFVSEYDPYKIDTNQKVWYTGNELASHLQSIANDDNSYTKFPKEFAILTKISYIGNDNKDEDYKWDKNVQLIFSNFFKLNKGKAIVNEKASSWKDVSKKPISYVTKINDFSNSFELIESLDSDETKLKIKANENIINDWNKIEQSGFTIAFITSSQKINVGQQAIETQKNNFINLTHRKDELLNDGISVNFSDTNKYGYVWIYSDQTNISNDNYPGLTSSQQIRYRQLEINGKNDDTQLRYLAIKSNFNKPAEIGLLSSPIETKQIVINVEYDWIKNTSFANGRTIQTLQLSDIETYESNIINKIEAQYKAYVDLKYQLIGPDGLDEQNLSAESLFNKINELRTQYSNKYLGLMRMDKNSQTNPSYVDYEVRAKFAITNGKNPVFNDPSANGRTDEKVNTDNINTHINLKQYVDFLKSKKLQFEGDASNVIKIIIPNNEENNSEFLGGKSFEQIVEGLGYFGVNIEFKAKEVDNAQWGNLSSINSFNENVGKILMRFSLANNLNVELLLSNNETLTSNDTNTTYSNEIELNLQVSLKVKVNQTFVDEFKASSPFEGNTKILTIDETKETKLIDSIINDNKLNNNAFEKLQLDVQYQLKGMTEWKNRSEFISFLKSETKDWESNEISIKIVIKNNANAEFTIDDKSYVAFEESIDLNSKIKLYINKNSWETLASEVKISGDSSALNWIWPDGLSLENTSNDVQGKIGLKLQFTTNKTLNTPPNNPNEYDPSSDKWTNIKPTSVDPANRYVAIAYVAKDGYVLWSDIKIHQVKFENLISKINVNLDWLNVLSFEGTNALDESKLLQKEIESKNQINANLKQYVDIEYQLVINDDTTTSQWVNANGLKNLIDQYVKSYSNETGGILKFGTNKNANDNNMYAKINAKFVSNNPDYSVYDQNNTKDPVKENLNVEIKTKIDLSMYYQILTTQKTIFDAGSTSSDVKGFTPPKMEGNEGESFLSGLSFNKIEEILNKVGIVIEFQSPNNGEQDDKTWKTKNEIKKLSHLNELKMRFRIENNNDANWSNSYLIYVKNSSVQENIDNPTGIDLIANLKKTINVDPKKDLVGYDPHGTTIGLENTSLKEMEQVQKQIIEKVKNSNASSSNTINDAKLNISYKLKEMDEWIVGINEFNNKLKELGNQKINFNSNEIQAKFYLDPSDENYILSSNDYHEIYSETFEYDTKFSIFIHKGEYEDISTLKAIGSNENFTIEGLKELQTKIPNGLDIQWSNKENPNEMENQDPNGSNISSDWSTVVPTTLEVHKKLWLRFNPKWGYFYEGKMESRPWSEKKQVNTSKIKVQLKLESNWLEKIILTGNNLINITNINEEKAIEFATNANQNPNQMIIIEYTFDGVNWYNKNDFIQQLKNSNGKRNEEYFFIKREDIKARFAIDSEKNKDESYSLNIDGQIITNENRDTFNKELITQNLNNSVKGYINLGFLSNFVKDTFQIKGTTSKPRLVIDDSKRNELNNLLNVYSSSNIFNILFTTTKNSNDNKPDFSETSQQIWKPNSGLIGENELNITIPSTKYFAIGFLLDSSKASEYEIHKDNEDYTSEGYSFVVDVQITIEIKNPFTNQNKKIEIIFNDKDNQTTRFYQGQGGFGLVEQNNITNWANNIIQNSNNLTDEEKNALELVYYASDVALTEEQFQNITSASEIQNYGPDAKWKAVNGNNYVDSNLKVGNYVIAALRVKQTQYEADNGFVLANDDFSPTNQTRAYGYFVKVDDLKLNTNSIEYQNTLNTWQEPLDGYSTIKNVSLTPDENGNYLGVDIKLNLFNQFHLDDQDKIIEINNQRLIVRDPSGATSKGNYKNNDGIDIVDKNGQTIPILVDNKGNLAKPKKEVDATRSVTLTQITEGSFTYIENDPKFNLFRNQDIQFEYVAKQGNDPTKPDFVLDNATNNKINYEIDNRVKFAIENLENVTYEFDKTILNDLEYQNATSSTLKPTNGGSKLITPIKAKITNKDGTTTELQGNDIVDSVTKTFNDKVKVQYTIIKGENGQETKYDGINVDSYTTLKNGDKIKVEMVASSNDYIFAQAPEPLIITVSGLLEKSPDKAQLEFLRVEQGGTINGQGSFKVLVNNPENDDTNNDESILAGYKFVIRVWNSQRKIKIDWTSDQQKLVNLVNGDKVEWKLVTAKGNPTTDQYYNTVSNGIESNNGVINYKFKQIQAIGNNAFQVVSESIGEVPTNDETYPFNSGFIIDGLSEHVNVEKLNESQFDYLMNELNWTWKGLNNQGYIYTNKNINSLEVPSAYVQNPLMKNQLDLSTKINVNLVNLFEKGIISFWNMTKEVGFNYSPDTLSNNLTNGDIIKAYYFDGQNKYEYDLGNVSGLANMSDQMNPLWWVLIGAGSIITLGGLAIFYFISRNRKLKK